MKLKEAQSQYRVMDWGQNVTPPKFYRLSQSGRKKVVQQIADKRGADIELVRDVGGKSQKSWTFQPKKYKE
jgi:hypothetical protein